MFLDHGGWVRDDIFVLLEHTNFEFFFQGQYDRIVMFIYLGLMHCEIGLNYIC
jgi:hypothetical protein